MHEIRVVHSVSEDGMTVTLTEPTDYFHTGQQVTEHGVDMDVRDTVSLLDRNVEMRAGHSLTFDEISGLSVRQQEYGFTITAQPRTTEPKPGYTPQDPDYLEKGVRREPAAPRGRRCRHGRSRQW